MCESPKIRNFDQDPNCCGCPNMGHGEWVVSPPEQDLLLQAFKPIIPAEKGVLNCPKLCDRNTGGSELTVQATVGALGSLANLKHADVFLQKHESSQIYPASISQSSWLKVDTAQIGVLKLSQLVGSDSMTYSDPCQSCLSSACETGKTSIF